MNTKISALTYWFSMRTDTANNINMGVGKHEYKRTCRYKHKYKYKYKYNNKYNTSISISVILSFSIYHLLN